MTRHLAAVRILACFSNCEEFKIPPSCRREVQVLINGRVRLALVAVRAHRWFHPAPLLDPDLAPLRPRSADRADRGLRVRLRTHRLRPRRSAHLPGSRPDHLV